MSSKEQILGTIRASLKKGGFTSAGKDAIEARLGTHARNTVPKRADGDNEQQTALFVSEAEKVDATTERVDGLADVGEAILRYLARHNLAGRIKIAPHPLLESIDWSQHPTLELSRGSAVETDQASLSVAVTGVAETGTLVLHSGPESPTTLNFLPDNHIVVLPRSQITGAYEDAWNLLRSGSGDMPRTVNWITGPSRSADIEQTLLLGAHGPRRLHILILDDKETR